MEEIWGTLGKRVGLISVNDRGFAAALVQKLDSLPMACRRHNGGTDEGGTDFYDGEI